MRQPVDTVFERGVTGFAGTADEWDALEARLAVSPFLRRRWFELWWDAFGSGRPVLATARRGGALVGVLPLCARSGVLTGMANTHTPLFDTVTDDTDVAAALWRAAMGHRIRRLGARSVRGDAVEALHAAAGAGGWRSWVRSSFEEPYIDLDDAGWDAYVLTLPGKMRQELRRRRRRLEEQAPLSFELATHEVATSTWREALRVEASGWKGEAGSAIACQERTQRFYEQLVAWGAGEGWLRVAQLRHGERLIGFQLLIEHGSCWFALKVGYDAEYARSAPGWLTLSHVLESAFDAGVQRYDFAGPATPEMQRWANGSITSHRIEAFHPMLGGIDRLALTTGRPLAKRLRDGARSSRQSRVRSAPSSVRAD